MSLAGWWFSPFFNKIIKGTHVPRKKKKKKKKHVPPQKRDHCKKNVFHLPTIENLRVYVSFRRNITWQIRGSRAYVSKGLSGSIASLEYWELYERCCGFKFILPSSYDVAMPILLGVLISHKIHVL